MLRRAHLLALLLGCDPAFEAPAGPELQAARPPAARPGQAVTLLGEDLGLQGPHDQLWLGGVKLRVLRWTDAAIDLEIPPEYRPGFADFVVRSGALVSAPLPFEVLPPR